MKKIRNRVASIGIPLTILAALSIALATSGTAAVPKAGVNCMQDGKISGRGATFQTRAQAAFATGFMNDVCGKVPDPANVGTPAAPTGDSGNDMVEYNVYNTAAGAPNVETGSGYGRKAASCRTDAFGGSDIPYNVSQLAALNGTPGTGIVACNAAVASGFGTDYLPPFQPQNGNPSSYPNPNDQTAKLMSFPVAGGAVAIMTNLTAADCGGTAPGALNLTASEVSKLFGGDITNWNNQTLVANNPNLANCALPVTRVVRLDDSGTTQIFKTYLKNVDSGRTGATCESGTSWQSLWTASPNTAWPSTQNQPGACSTLLRGDINGNNGVLDVCSNESGVGPGVRGEICYADLPDAKGYVCPSGHTCNTLTFDNVQNATQTSYQSASKVTAANCNFGAVAGPSGGPSGAVGLTSGDSWAFDNPSGYHGDASNTGSAYPICGVTWDLVYAGLGQGTPNGTDSAISNLNADQRRTLYSYFTYVLGSTGQNLLTTRFYGALPSSLLSQELQGFQANF